MQHDVHHLPFDDERLTAYLDGELSGPDRERLEADLQRDPALRAELDALTSVRTFLKDHVPRAAPADFLDDVLAATAGENVVQLAWYRRPFGIPLEGLAVAAAALLVVYVALPGRTPVSSEAPSEVASARSAPPASSALSKRPADVAGSVDNIAGLSKGGALDQAASLKEDLEAWKTTDELEKKRKAVELQSVSREGGADDFAVPAEQAQTAVGGVESTPKALFVQVPYSYRIVTQDPAVLAQLSALASRYSGELKQSNELQLDTLSPARDAASVTVKLPASALRDFGRSLQSLGSVQAIADNSMFAGDPVEVSVSVQLAPQARPPGRKASSKKLLPSKLPAADGL